ncbi:MAG TPA: hypothetical protein PLI09_25800 [Candidatus Hydrogenedentes bacterium]|nr:hypothetical protein [Candidatus Hydrogenedentota bacterium]
MVKVIDVGQSAGKIITQNTGSVSPGEVRPDLRVTFSATISRLLTLLDRVDQLAQQSEQYFWQMRITDLSINSMNFSQGMLGKLTDGTGVENAIEGAQKLCLAAHPMLDEILERIAYICDLDDYKTLGTATGDTSWDVSTATQTFYLPTVRQVCTALRALVQQMESWSANSEDFDAVVAIREQYSGVLETLYNRARALVNQLGPLWPPVICNFTPFVADTVDTRNNAELFFPDGCDLTPLDTQQLEVSFWMGSAQVRADDLVQVASGCIDDEYFDASEWAAAPEPVNGGHTAYRTEGGLVAIEQLSDSSDMVRTGIYEILDVSDVLVLNNERMQLSTFVSTDASSLGSITFLLRLLRKRKELTDEDEYGGETIINAQYRAAVSDADEEYPAQYFTLDDDQAEQNFSYVFQSVKNEHTAPTVSLSSNAPAGMLAVWRRYDADTYDGDVVHMGQEQTDLPLDTVYIASLIEGLGIEGTVRSIVVSGTDVYIGGGFESVNGLTDYHHLAKFDATTGELDLAFVPDIGGDVNALGIAPTGDLFVGGSFASVGGDTTYQSLVRFRSDILVTDFHFDFNNAAVLAIAFNATVGMFVGGTFTSINGKTGYNHLAKIDITTDAGALEKKYVFDGNVYALAVDVANNLYVGGAYEKHYANAYPYLVKLDSAGKLVTDWTPNLNDVVNSLFIYDGNLYVGGAFTSVDGDTAYTHLVRYGNLGGTPALDATFITAIDNGTVHEMTEAAGVLYAGGSFTSAHGGNEAYRYIIAYNIATGALVDTFHPYVNARVNGLTTIAGPHILMGGRFTNVAGIDRGCAISVNVNGAWEGTYGVTWTP